MHRSRFVIPGCLPVLAAILVHASTVNADDWPQWRGPQRDGVWRETGIIEKFAKRQLDIKWRAPIGSGYCGPTVAKGLVYVMDRVVEPKQVERVHCFGAKSGKRVWSYSYECNYRDVSYDAGPRASVTVDEGRAYALGTMGHFHCFDAKSGAIRWKKDLLQEYAIEMPIWGISASPLIEDDLVIVQIGGTPGAGIVAFDKKTGKLRWKALNDGTSYSAPIVIDHAGHRILVCYMARNVVGLNPKNGEVYWQHPFPPTRMVIGVASPVLHQGHLFMTNFFDGSMLLKLVDNKQAVEQVWLRVGDSEKKTDAIQSIINTPLLKGDHIYGVDSYGELRCLDLRTGDRVWEDLSAVPKARWATIHFVEQEDKAWMFNERGELIISRLSPKGFEEISRAKLLEPTLPQLKRRGGVCWSHPAFADKHIFARNDKELVCADLAKK